MNASARTILPACLLLVAASCGDEGGGTGPEPEEPVFPENFASTYTEVRDLRASTPHAFGMRVYANSVGATAYTAGNYPLPEGTVLVKESYSDLQGLNVTGWVAMEKREPGFAASTGDWFWQEVDTDRSVLQSGQVQNCIGCHTTSCPTTDFVCTDP